MTGGAGAFAETFGVSRETMMRLEAFVELLARWQPAQNLVSAATLGDVWARHIADSAQLIQLAPTASNWLDLGSGAGFPGIVIATLMRDKGGAVSLIESNHRKCAFLRAAARVTETRVAVVCERIESVLKRWDAPVDIVTARALAPLTELCGWLEPIVNAGARALLHKGREIDSELAEAAHQWRVDLVRHPSRVEPGSVVLEIRGLERVRGATAR